MNILCHLKNRAKKVVNYLIIITLLYIATPVFSQGFGSNPPGTDWKTINTEHYEIIFPAELETDAQRVANTLEATFLAVNKSMYTNSPRISLILNNQGILPNGYVRLAPRMSEWYAAPPQNSSVAPLLGTGDWYNILASHEIRHVAQLEAMNKGFTYIIYLFFGEAGRSFMSFLSMPGWVMEGDAVGTETALSGSGRGRLPSYDMEIRALLLSGERYSYYKAWLGSYADHYPDIYHLGYLLTTHIKNKYGVKKLADAIAKTGKLSFWPFAFTSALNSRTRKGASAMYEETMNELKSLWEKQLEGLGFTKAKIINKTDSSDWISYAYPQYGSDKSIYAIKYGKGIPTTLVKIQNDGKEVSLEQISLIFPVFKLGGDKIAWNDMGYNIRWSSRNYSEILNYNIKTGSSERITSGTRYISPAPSPDGNQIIAVEFDEERQSKLVLLDSKTGKSIKAYTNPKNFFITSPSWSEDGKRICFTKQKLNGKGLSVLDLASGNVSDIIPEGWENISDPVFFKDYIIYNSPYSGIDNIYAIDIKTNKKFQITSRKFGAFNPCISKDGKKMLFNDYNMYGYQIAEMDLVPENWMPIEKIEDRNINYYKPMVDQEQGKNVFDEKEIPRHKYEVEDYSSLSHLFNIHSWTLNPLNWITPSVQVSTEDVLGKTQMSAGLTYNLNEKEPGGNFSISYAGLFPVVTAGISHEGRSVLSEFDEFNNPIYRSWRETSANFGISLPFDLTKGIFYRGLELGARAEYTRILGEEAPDWKGIFAVMQYYLQFYNTIQSTSRDIRPKWGQNLFLTYINSPFESDIKRKMIALGTDFYFPGLFRHHSIRLQGNYEYQENNDAYSLSSYMLFPRGYNSFYSPYLIKYSIDYTFPIVYPDLDIGHWFYFKRIKGNFFFDYGEGRNEKFVTRSRYKSLGAELTTDFHLFSWRFLVDLGVRASYLPEATITENNKFELIFNLGL